MQKMTEKDAVERIKATPLMRYESEYAKTSELGQSLRMAINALEKQIPKKPHEINIPNTSWSKSCTRIECSSCGKYLNYRELSYCGLCGQSLDWCES